MANINWSAIGSSLSGVASTLSSLGITGANASSILGAIGLSANPNQSAELAICSSILMGMAKGSANQSCHSLVIYVSCIDEHHNNDGCVMLQVRGYIA